jgi:hypothetical protein
MCRPWQQQDIRRCINSVFLPLAKARSLPWRGQRFLVLTQRSPNWLGLVRHPWHPHAVAPSVARPLRFDMHRRAHSTNSPDKQTKHDPDDGHGGKQHLDHSTGHSHSHGENGHSHSHSHSHGAQELVVAFQGASTSLYTLPTSITQFTIRS